MHDHGSSSRKSGSHPASVLHGASLFQNHSKMADRSGETIRVGVPQTRFPRGDRDPGASVLAGHATQTQTPETHRIPGVSYTPGNRRIGSGLGSDRGKLGDPRKLVTEEAQSSHKRERTSGRVQGSKTLHSSAKRQKCSDRGGQHVLPSLHQEEGRLQEPPSESSSHPDLGMGTSAQYESGNHIHPGSGECETGSPVQTVSHRMVGEPGVDAGSLAVPSSRPESRSSTEGPVRQSRESSTPSVHDLAVSPLSDQRLSSPVEGRGLCLSPIRSNSEGPEEGQEGQVSHHSDSTSLGNTTVVPDPSEHVVQQPGTSEILPPSSDRQGGEPSPSGQVSQSGGMACDRQKWVKQGASERVAAFITTHGLAEETKRSYDSCWKVWTKYCAAKGMDPSKPDIEKISEFLLIRSEEHNNSHSRVRIYASALSKYLPHVEGAAISEHSVIKSLLYSIWRKNPPRPKYNEFWDAELILKAWDVPNSSLTMLELSHKTLALFSISTLSRSVDVSKLLLPDIDAASVDHESVTHLDLQRGKIPKTQRSGVLKPVKIQAFAPDKANMCPVRACLAYMVRTGTLRQPGDRSLFISSKKPHNGIKPYTARGWLVRSLEKAGIDTSTFSSHSYRGAGATGQKQNGASLADIMKLGNWKSASTLQKYYLR